MFILLYSEWASTRRPRKFGSVYRTQLEILSKPKSSHSAWRLSSLQFNWFRGHFIRNKENWRESECSHSCSDEDKNVYSHKNSADDFLARRETTLLATKTKYIMGEDVLFHDMHYL